MPPETESASSTTNPPPKPARRARHYALVIVALVVIVGALAAIKFAQIRTLIGYGHQMAAAGPPPETVSSDIAQASTWESTLTAVGSISGVQSVAIANDAPGIVTRLDFESGVRVKRGQVLVELDAKPERAQLAAARARRANAELTASRSRELVAHDALPKAQLDADETQLTTAIADVAAAEAQIERKVVRAPFDGRLGIRAVDVGQYLNPGTRIATIESVEGTFVDFTLPQEQLSTLHKGMPVRITIQGTAAPLDGTITAVSPTVDSSSRNVNLRATVVDPNAALRPGMFVTVAVILPQRPSLVTLPATAIVHASYGDSVYLIEAKPAGSPGIASTPDGKPVKIARQQFVRVGPARGDFVAIASGVDVGQAVVSAGAFKLRNGSPVVVDNSVKPTALLEPHPENR